jgi:hypothetical protein
MILERHIEKVVSAYAMKLGWLTYKFASPSNRSVPDRIYLKDGDTIFIEFKREGKVPSKLQAHTHLKYQQAGHTVIVIDSVEQGKDFFNEQE